MGTGGTDSMIRIDENYTDYFDATDPAYPGGKAIPVSQGNRTDGTPWRALWFNTIFGFFTALIVEAWGEFTISGEPDKVGQSDLLNALRKVIADMTGVGELDARITENANAITDIFGSVNNHEERLDTLEPLVSNNTQGVSVNAGKINVLQQTLATLNWLLSIGAPPADGKTYGFRNRAYAEASAGGGTVLSDAILALKFYSKKTIMFTNARIVNRRQKRWDIGLPYLSGSTEVYHFDTDTNNVDQEASITIGYSGEAPALVGADDNNGQIYLGPAVLDVAPYEMKGRSLYGHFSISAQIPKIDATVEFWGRPIQTQNIVILRAGLAAEDEIVLNIGGSDPAYSAPDVGDIAYSLPEGDGVAYSTASTTGNRLDHTWPAGSESVDLDAEGIAITQNTWTHLAVVSTAENISLFINKNRIDFEKYVQTPGNMNVEINEDQDEFNLDELAIDRSIAATFERFSANSDNHVPYAALNYQEKWMVLMAEDPEKVKTNLFETEQFRNAVQAVIAQ
jgi:hypothetical protein